MQDFEQLTKQEIKDRLQTDMQFALNFMVDNQPELIVSELQANGSQNVVDSETAYIAGMTLPLIGGLIGGGGGGTNEQGYTQAQVLAMQQEAQRVEDERKARRNIYIIGGVIVAVFIVVLVVTMNKNKTSTKVKK